MLRFSRATLLTFLLPSLALAQVSNPPSQLLPLTASVLVGPCYIGRSGFSPDAGVLYQCVADAGGGSWVPTASGGATGPAGATGATGATGAAGSNDGGYASGLWAASSPPSDTCGAAQTGRIVISSASGLSGHAGVLWICDGTSWNFVATSQNTIYSSSSQFPTCGSSGGGTFSYVLNGNNTIDLWVCTGSAWAFVGSSVAAPAVSGNVLVGNDAGWTSVAASTIVAAAPIVYPCSIASLGTTCTTSVPSGCAPICSFSVATVNANLTCSVASTTLTATSLAAQTGGATVNSICARAVP